MATKKAPAAKKPAAAQAPDYSTLKHARGPAKDTPGHLENLRSKAAAKRIAALDALEGTLFSQGKFYPAAAAAVPELVARATDPAQADRPRILGLLANILTAGRAQRLAVPADRRDSAVVAQYAKGDAKRIDDLLAGAAGNLAALLDDDDAAVRTFAAFLLGSVRDAGSAATPRLIARIAKETDATARVSEMLATGLLGRATGGEAERSFLAKTVAAKSQAAAPALLALGMCGALPSPVPTEPLVELLRIKDARPEALPQNGGRLLDMTCQVMRAAGTDAQRALEDALVSLVLEAKGDAHAVLTDPSRGWVPALVGLMFEPAESRAAGDLTERQRAILGRLSAFPLSSEAMQAAGIPPETETRRRWLGLDAPGALEKRIPYGGKKPVPAHQAIAAAQEEGIDEEVIDAELAKHLSPVERAQAYADMAVGLHGLNRMGAAQMVAAFRAAGAAGLPFARKLVEHYLASPVLGANGKPRMGAGIPDGTNPALLALREAGEALDAKYDLAISLQSQDATRALLAPLPIARREAVALGILDPTAVGWIGMKMLSYVSELVATPALVDKTFAAIARIEDEDDRESALDAILPALQEIAEEREDIRAVLARHGKA